MLLEQCSHKLGKILDTVTCVDDEQIQVRLLDYLFAFMQKSSSIHFRFLDFFEAVCFALY